MKTKEKLDSRLRTAGMTYSCHSPTWRLCRNYDIRGIVILNLVQNLVVSRSYEHMRSRNEFGMTIATQPLDRGIQNISHVISLMVSFVAYKNHVNEYIEYENRYTLSNFVTGHRSGKHFKWHKLIQT